MYKSWQSPIQGIDMASSAHDDEDLMEAVAAQVTDEDAVLQFLAACRNVQTQAAALCADSALPARTREMLKDLRLRLLAARKVLLTPEPKESSGKAAGASDPLLLRRPPPGNPLAPRPPKAPVR